VASIAGVIIPKQRNNSIDGASDHFDHTAVSVWNVHFFLLWSASSTLLTIYFCVIYSVLDWMDAYTETTVMHKSRIECTDSSVCHQLGYAVQRHFHPGLCLYHVISLLQHENLQLAQGPRVHVSATHASWERHCNGFGS